MKLWRGPSIKAFTPHDRSLNQVPISYLVIHKFQPELVMYAFLLDWTLEVDWENGVKETNTVRLGER